MNKLSNGKWSHQTATVGEVSEVISQIREMVSEYGWGDRTIRPYAYTMTVNDLIYSDGWNNFKQYTSSSKHLIISEINGLIDMLVHWEAIEKEEKITIRLTNGKVITCSKSVADEFVEMECATLV